MIPLCQSRADILNSRNDNLNIPDYILRSCDENVEMHFVFAKAVAVVINLYFEEHM